MCARAWPCPSATEPRPARLRVAERGRLELVACRAVRSVGRDVVEPEPQHRYALALAVLLADDEILRDVDETTRQVPRVRGTESSIDETLAGARRGDEVLEHREAFTEVRLDRTRDHVAARVGHETAHTGDLTDLHHVPSSTRA